MFDSLLEVNTNSNVLGAQFYVFSIIVEERGHLPRVSTSPSTTENIESTPATELLTVGKWIVERRCDDFYQLAERLQDLQGTALSELPDRSTALYAKNNRMFMEINCVCFERYLKALLEQVYNLQIFVCSNAF